MLITEVYLVVFSISVKMNRPICVIHITNQNQWKPLQEKFCYNVMLFISDITGSFVSYFFYISQHTYLVRKLWTTLIYTARTKHHILEERKRLYSAYNASSQRALWNITLFTSAVLSENITVSSITHTVNDGWKPQVPVFVTSTCRTQL
jgi:hypothetical protein